MDDTQATKPSAETSPRRSKRWPWFPIVVLILGVALFLAAPYLEEWDSAFPMLARIVSVGGTTLVLAVWALFYRGFPLPVRFVPITVIALGITLFFWNYRIAGFTGGMQPRIVSRDTPAFDLTLDPLEVLPTDGPEESGPDFSAIGEHDSPRFLGPGGRPEFDGIQLETDWENHPPRTVWRQPIGSGWSSFAIVNGYAMTMEQRGDDELTTCYELETGIPVWSHAETVRFTELMGGIGPRTTPTIAAGKVYSVGATGILNCLDDATGKVVWRKDLLEDNQAVNVRWGKSNSPLVVNDVVIVSAGGAEGRSLVAYDKETGERRWSGGDEQSSYSSPVLATLHGEEVVLIVNEAHFAIHRFADGELLVEYEWPGSSGGAASVSQPVPLSDNQIFLCKGYGGGSAVIEISKDGESWSVSEIWKNRRNMKTKFTNVVLHDGYVYGLDEGILSCVNLGTGEREWKRGRYGHGQIIRFSEVILVLGESGELALVEASPQQYRELARIQAVEGKTWANPAFSFPYLLVRSAQEAACYELPMKSPPPDLVKAGDHRVDTLVEIWH